MATVHYPCRLRSGELQASSLKLFKSGESVFPDPRSVIRRANGVK
jgi:hypothetical protein